MLTARNQTIGTVYNIVTTKMWFIAFKICVYDGMICAFFVAENSMSQKSISKFLDRVTDCASNFEFCLGATYGNIYELFDALNARYKSWDHFI
jgi:hypothetical protein